MGCWSRVLLDCIVFLGILGSFGINASHSSVKTARLLDRLSRRPASSLEGRRGDMDDDFGVVQADLSVGVDRRPNRTPGQREIALASLEILVSGERAEPTTERTEVAEVTRKPSRPCENGGIRLLKSFCYCPPKYMGRYCEIYRYNSSCGRVPHGRWIYIDCNTCYCFAGVLKCQAHPMDGCDGASTTEPPAEAALEDELDASNAVVALDLQDGSVELGNGAISRSPHINTLLACLSLYFVFCSLLTRQHGRHR